MTESSELERSRRKNVPDPPDLGQDKAILSLDNLGIFPLYRLPYSLSGNASNHCHGAFSLGFNLSFLQGNGSKTYSLS